MIERIVENEERLDNILISIKNLEEALKCFDDNRKNVMKVNKYYGSKNWFKDKEAFENNKIPKIKAGVLSEDAVWNMNDNIKEILLDMKKIILNYK